MLASLVSDVICNNGSVIIANYDAKKEFAVRINNKRLYRSLLAIFDILWNALTIEK